MGRVSAFFRNWRAADRASLQLDALLASADPGLALAERNEWLVEFGYWMRRRNRISGVGPAAVLPLAKTEEAPRSSSPGLNDGSASPPRRRDAEALTRLRYVLAVLDRNPEWKERVSALLVSIGADLDAVALLCDVGLAQNPGFWSEMRERISVRFIPATPDTRDWEELLTLLFPQESSAQWIESIDANSWIRLRDLFSSSSAPSALHFQRDIVHSLRILVSQIRAAAFTSNLRTRMEIVDFARSPFLPLERALEDLFGENEWIDSASSEQVQKLNLFHAMLEECRALALGVFEHLDENGVSVEIVFQVERILARIARIELLLQVILHPEEPAIGKRMLTDLIRSNQARLSLTTLSRRAFARLARKVVERSAETGEHYIARTKAEYRGMLVAAAGGGALTAITVFLKFAITGLHLPKLFEGLLSSLNYAGSFVLLQFLGLTLATKQPAMTAPALAEKLDGVGRSEGMSAFVEETLSLVRSQIASVIGNVALVVPVAYLIQWSASHLLGVDLISPVKAHATIASFSLLGVTPFFAAFTGVLLWMSSVIAGWADNWFVFRRIGEVLRYHRRLCFVLGRERAGRLSRWAREHVSGLAGNISLGFLLGMTPAIGAMFAIVLEVRHVTLSAGSIAAAVAVIGWPEIESTEFWWAVAGVVSMAFLNVGVSFMFAFQMALRSRDLPPLERSHIYAAILRQLVRRPLSLFIAPAASSLPVVDAAD